MYFRRERLRGGFFTGCPLHCVYCQNYAISDGGTGRQITVEALVQIFRDLEAQGAANINLVTADHFIPQVAQAIRQAKDQGFSCHLSITQAVMSGWKLCVC